MAARPRPLAGTSRYAALTAQLTEIGMTRNEAVAYLTLVEDDDEAGLTGYEVAARSGIPRSAVYGVLRKLEESSAAFANGHKPVRYVATDPEQLVEHVRRTNLAQLDQLAEGLSSLPKRVRPEPVWILRRYHEVMQRAGTMIRGAQQSVYLSIWPRELQLLAPDLESIGERSLHRVLHSPAPLVATPPGFSCWIDEEMPGDEAKALWSHKVLVVVDRRAALIGGAEPDADNHAVWTTNPSLVDVATNHIVLDITLMSRRSGRDCVGDVAPMMRPHLDRND